MSNSPSEDLEEVVRYTCAMCANDVFAHRFAVVIFCATFRAPTAGKLKIPERHFGSTRSIIFSKQRFWDNPAF